MERVVGFRERISSFPFPREHFGFSWGKWKGFAISRIRALVGTIRRVFVGRILRFWLGAGLSGFGLSWERGVGFRRDLGFHADSGCRGEDFGVSWGFGLADSELWWGDFNQTKPNCQN